MAGRSSGQADSKVSRKLLPKCFALKETLVLLASITARSVQLLAADGFEGAATLG